MATVKFVEEANATGRVREIYADIKQVFGAPFVPNLFKAMAAIFSTPSAAFAGSAVGVSRPMSATWLVTCCSVCQSCTTR
jgi:hypothetical protein